MNRRVRQSDQFRREAPVLSRASRVVARGIITSLLAMLTGHLIGSVQSFETGHIETIILFDYAIGMRGPIVQNRDRAGVGKPTPPYNKRQPATTDRMLIIVHLLLEPAFPSGGSQPPDDRQATLGRSAPTECQSIGRVWG